MKKINEEKNIQVVKEGKRLNENFEREFLTLVKKHVDLEDPMEAGGTLGNVVGMVRDQFFDWDEDGYFMDAFMESVEG